MANKARRNIIGGLLAIPLLVFIIGMLNAIHEMAWRDGADASLKNVSIAVRVFRDESGHYPTRLLDAFEDGDFSTNDAFLRGTTYEYRATSNGFTLTAVKPPSLFSGEWRQRAVFSNERVQP